MKIASINKSGIVQSANFITDANASKVSMKSTGITATEFKRIAKPDIIHYPMNEGAGTTIADYSGNNRTANIVGAQWVDDNPSGSGKCLSFDGVDDYCINQSNFIFSNITNSFTIDFWCKCNTNATDMMIFNKDQQTVGNIPYIYLARPANSNILQFQLAASNTRNFLSVSSFFSGYNNTWVRVTITCNFTNNEVKFYRNGIFMALTQHSALDIIYPNLNSKMYIGRYISGIYYFKGYLSNFKIIDGVFLSSEIDAATLLDPNMKARIANNKILTYNYLKA
jgi:hypothetical protein